MYEKKGFALNSNEFANLLLRSKTPCKKDDFLKDDITKTHLFKYIENFTTK